MKDLLAWAGPWG